ncbi:F-box domain-containing protein [Mycena chlorophos]|uniref:F-box domain-containing protein n=1 Tax=Mycena chlorophos TaxID=658473 RepID=A0A8H6VP81_MYCCL|nr:F-box domain-containing protein [Mycena chlorophos]
MDNLESAPSPTQDRLFLENLDRAIASARATAKDVAQEIHHLETSRADVCARLARITFPISSLPPELLSRIFLATLPSHGRVRPAPRSPPIVFLRVCKYWTQVAISTPQLWSSIDYTPSEWARPRSPSEVPTAIVAIWLTRSSSVPLSWTQRAPWAPRREYFGSRDAVAPVEDEYIETDAGDPINAARLWRLETDAEAHNGRGLEGFLPLRTPLPLLRCLSARLHPQKLADILAHAPQLSEMNVFVTSRDFRVSSTVLRQLKIESLMTVQAALRILRDCPQLTHFKCFVPGCNRGCVLPTHPTVQHANLRSIELEGPLEDPGLLAHLGLPALTCLKARHNLTNLLQFTGPQLLSANLSELWMTVTVSSAENIAGDLRRVANVEDIHLRVTSGQLTPVVVALDDETLLPRLRRLTITYVNRYCADLDYNRILEMLDSRASALESFNLVFDMPSNQHPYIPFVWHPRKWAAAGFERLMEAGMGLSIRFDASDADEVTVWPESVVLDPTEDFELNSAYNFRADVA